MIRHAYYILIILALFVQSIAMNSYCNIVNLDSVLTTSDKAQGIVGNFPFFWKEFVTSEDLTEEYIKENAVKMQTPGNWNSIKIDGKRLSGKGYGTLVIPVIPPKEATKLAVKLPAIRTAYALYLDSTLITQVGTPGTTQDSSSIHFETKAISLPLQTEPFNLIFHISNFENNKGGPWKLIYIGTERAIFRLRNISLSYDLFFIGFSLLFIFIYKTSYPFIINRYEKRVLNSLTIFTAAMLLRTSLTGERFLYSLLPDVSSLIMVKLEYISFFVAGCMFHIFVHYSFRKWSSVRFKNILLYGTLIYCIIVLLTPLSTNSRIIASYQVVIFFTMAYQITLAFRSRQELGQKSFILLISILTLFITAIHDITGAHGVAVAVSLAPLGNMIVILLQTLLLSMEHAALYFQKVSMAQRLVEINATLNCFLPLKILNILETSPDSIHSGIQKECNLTVLVADIRQFTTLSERMSPEMTFSFINRFHSETIPIISAHNGFINNFVGDAFVAVFPHSPEDAVKAAIEIQTHISSGELFSPYMLEKNIKLGIGIEHGQSTLGIIGGKIRMENVLLGHSFTVASQLENLTKQLGSSILITENICNQLPANLYETRYLGIKKSQSLQFALHELFVEIDSPDTKRKQRTQEKVERAVQFMDKDEFASAKEILNTIPREIIEHDRAIAYLINQCKTDT